MTMNFGSTFQSVLEEAVLASLTIIILFQLAGDALQNMLRLPIPGPVIGMALLLGGLLLDGRLPTELDRAATGILAYLPMLFVPAGVGVMAHFDLIGANLPAIITGVMVSSVPAIVITAATMRGVERLQQALAHALRRRLPEPTVDALR